MSEKRDNLKALVAERKDDQWPSGSRCFKFADFHNGIFDKDEFLVPWTI